MTICALLGLLVEIATALVVSLTKSDVLVSNNIYATVNTPFVPSKLTVNVSPAATACDAPLSQ